MALGGNTAELIVDLKFDDSKAAAALQSSLQGLTRQTQNFNRNPIIAKNFTQPLGRITGAADEFTKSLEASNARVLAFGASAGAIFAVEKAMSELVKTTITVEQKLTDINVLLNVSDKQFKRFSDGLFQVARQTGTAFGEVADSANEFARQGLSVEDTLKRTNAALALSKLGMMDSVNATESLTAALNTFKGEVNDSAVVVNKLAQVDAEFAVSSKDLAEAIKRTGASAKDASVSFDELLAAVTVTQERTARGGAVIGNAFKTIFTRIQRPEVLNQLELVGVQVRKQSGEVLPAIEILKQYGAVYDNLTPTVQSNTSALIAGGRQINILKAFLPELAASTGKFDSALRVANETTTEATDRLKILTSTTQGTVNAVTANLTKTASEIGSLSIKPAIDNILKGLDTITDLVGPSNFFGLGETIGKGVYEGIGKVLSGPGIILLSTVLAKLGGNLLRFVSQSGASFLGLNKQAEEQARTQTIIGNILAQRPEVMQRILAGQISQNDAAKVFANELKMAEAHYQNLNNLAASLAAKQRTFGGPSRKKTNAEGLIPNFVPNFAMADAEAEREAASQGGYRAGQIRRMNMPGMGPVTYNGKEDVKKFPGMEQPAIMPPALSKAGRDYRDQFKSVIGFDPYNEGAAFGFVPNFSAVKRRQVNEISLDEMRTDPVLSQIIRGMTGPDSSKKQQMQKLGRAKGGDPAVRERMLNLTPLGQQRRRLKELSAEQRAEVRKGGTIDMQQKVGILSLLGGMNDPNATTTSSIGQLAVFDDILAGYNSQGRKLLSDAPITFKNVQVRSLDKAKEDIAKGKTTGVYDNFRKSLNDNLPDTLAAMANAIGQPILGNQSDGVSELKKKLKGNVNSILPTGAEGAIFESLVRFITKKPGQFIASLGGDEQAAFDFEEAKAAGRPFRHAFYGDEGFNPNALIKADAKRTSTASSVRELIKKSYNQAITSEDSDERRLMRDFKLPYTSALNLASGLVPNFSLKGISDAIKREDRSGVRRDKIRVGYDRRLAASGGLGVYNTDEGSLSNAINMHMAAGRNKFQIQRQGKANGHVPNFAPGIQFGQEGTFGLDQASLGALDNLTVALNKTGSGTFEGASKRSPKFGGSSVGGGTLAPAMEEITKTTKEAAAEQRINTTITRKNSKTTEDLNKTTEMGLGAMAGLILVGGQLSSFGDNLKESESSLVSFSGEVLSFGGAMAMYMPTVEIGLKTLGVEGNNVGEQLKNLKAMVLSSVGSLKNFRTALLGSTVSGGAQTFFGGSGSVVSRFRTGRAGAAIQGPVMPGQASLGRAGGGIMGGLRGVAAGGGLVGKAAGGLAAAGPAIAVLGGAFAAYKLLNRSSDAAAKQFQKSTESFNTHVLETKTKFESLGRALQGLTADTTALQKALEENNTAEAERLKNELTTNIRKNVASGALSAAQANQLTQQINQGDIAGVANTLAGFEAALNKQKESFANQEKLVNAISAIAKDPSQGVADQNLAIVRTALAEALGAMNETQRSQATTALDRAAALDVDDTAFQSQRGKIFEQGEILADVMDLFVTDAAMLEQAQAALLAMSKPNILRKILDTGNQMDKTQDILGAIGGVAKDANKKLGGLNKAITLAGVATAVDKYKQARESLEKMNDGFERLSKFSKLGNELAKIQREAEEKRRKIVVDSNTKILKDLTSEFSAIQVDLENSIASIQSGTQNKILEAQDEARQRQLDSVKDFGKSLETELKNQEPVLLKAMQGLTEELQIAVQQGASGARLREIVNDTRANNPNFTPRGGPESTLITGLFTKLNRTFTDNQFTTNSTLEKIAKINEQELITAKLQAKTQLETLQLTQALRFGGEAALDPEQFLRNIAKNQTDLIVGNQLTGDRSQATRGLTGLIKQLRNFQIIDQSGTLGGFSAAITSQAAKQIEGNLRKVLNELKVPENAFDSVRISGIDGQGIKAIAEAQARALTKPDIEVQQLERLKEISNILDGVQENGILQVNETNKEFTNAIKNAVGAKNTAAPKETPVQIEARERLRQAQEAIRGPQREQAALLGPRAAARAQADATAGNILSDENRQALKDAIKELTRVAKELDDQMAPLFDRRVVIEGQLGQANRKGETKKAKRLQQQLREVDKQIGVLQAQKARAGMNNEIFIRQGRQVPRTGVGGATARQEELLRLDREARQFAANIQELDEKFNKLTEVIKPLGAAIEQAQANLKSVNRDTVVANLKSGGAKLKEAFDKASTVVKDRAKGFIDTAKQAINRRLTQLEIDKQFEITTNSEGTGSSARRALLNIIDNQLMQAGVFQPSTLRKEEGTERPFDITDPRILRGRTAAEATEKAGQIFADALKKAGRTLEESEEAQNNFRKSIVDLGEEFINTKISAADFNDAINNFGESMRLFLEFDPRNQGASAEGLRNQLENAISRSQGTNLAGQTLGGINDPRNFAALSGRGAVRSIGQMDLAAIEGQLSNVELTNSVANITTMLGGITEVNQKFAQMGDVAGAAEASEKLKQFYSKIIEDGKVTAEELAQFNAKVANQNFAASQAGFANNLITQSQLQASANEALTATLGDATENAEALGNALGTRFQYNAATFREQTNDLILGVVDDFKSGVKGAFGEAIRGTATLREAFGNMFDRILDNMLDKSLNRGVDALFGAVGAGFGFKKGGRVKGYNAGGFVNQGSGVRDDVPAMMQGGEYVIRKSSVNKYGRGLFDALNSGGRVGYQTGDRIMQNRLRPEFVYNDPKRPTSGSYINTEGLSAFALMESGSPMIGIQREREKTLEQYIKDKAAYDEMVRKAQEQFKKQQKARMRSTLISVGLQAATFGLSQMGQGAQGTGGVTGEPYSAGAAPGPYAPGKAPVYYGPANASNVKMYMPSGREFGPYTDILPNPDALPPYQFRANGGLIKAFARGGRNRDNIPALLMGGEYVVNKRSVDKYGVGLFNDLNSGRAQGFANGGMVGGDTSVTGGAPTTANNNFEINITMNGSGEGETTTTSNQNENQSQEQQERNEQLGLAVKNAVQTELIEQQRPGGLLYREDRI